MIVNFEDITFFASNVPKEVECCINRVNRKVFESFDTEEQRQAYNLGVKNTLSFLKQLLDEGIGKNRIIFYDKSVDSSEEMTAEEVMELISNLPEKV